MSYLHVKEVTVSNTWVMDSHGTRGEAELGATVEAVGEGEDGALPRVVTAEVSDRVGSANSGGISIQPDFLLDDCGMDRE